MAGNIPLPKALHPRTKVEVEFVFDNAPSVGVNSSGGASADCIGTEAAILWGITVGIRCKEIAVFSVNKVPSNAIPFMGKGGIPCGGGA
jgi:hypothetical protein